MGCGLFINSKKKIKAYIYIFKKHAQKKYSKKGNQ